MAWLRATASPVLFLLVLAGTTLASFDVPLKATEDIEDNATKAGQEQVVTNTLPDFAIRTRTGQSVNIALSKREDSLQETFSIITNHDEVLPLNNRIPGVTVQGGSDFVANRITIGPMSESLLGRWTLCGETSRERRCQPVDIVWSNTNNPSQEWNTTQANQRDIFTNNLAVVDATVRGAGGLLTCHIITPSGDDITVNSDSTYRGIAFQPVQDSNLCTVSLGPIHNQFIGVWTIYAQFMSNTLGRSEVRSSFRIRLNDGEVPTQLLRDFAIRTRTGQSVNIALSKREDSLQETFSIITNKNEVLPLDNSISGVTVQGGSDFVSNRITIGPMSDSLLGRWTLCGETSRDKRCQPVDIVWGNANNPSQEWNTTTADQEDIFTNNLAVVDATVRGAGGLLTCHIITPSGDDITVNSDSTYRGIEFKPVQDSNLCTVSLGPIHKQFIGVWTIYAQFMSNTLGRSEVRSSFRIRLNDGEAPIQLLRDFAIRTRTGQSVNIALSRREDSLQETFSIITNHDEVLPLNNRIPGVTVQGGSDFVANRITIGPMSEALLGRWTLCGETSRDKRCQPVDIVWSNTNNPSQEWNTTQANQRDIFTNNLAVVDATVRGAGGLLTCHVITPSGDDITVNGDSTYRGIEFKPVQGSNLCTVSFGPIHNQFIGVWTIYAQFMSNTLGRSEVRSSFRIRLNDGEVPTQLLRDFAIRTRTGQSVNIALSKREDSLQETFSIITNKNVVLPLDNSISGVTVQGGSDFVANRITIGPMSESLLGRWTLCGETSRNKRCQPVDIFWGNANNPSQEWNTTTADQEDVFTNNLAVVDATVRGAGGLLTCHIITPSGDDITVNSDSTYPGIEFKPAQDSNLCTVSLGPIHKQFIGVWTIYAQFMSNTLGRSEVRSSFRIRLNDGEAPIQLLRDFTIRTRTGLSVNIALSKREDSLQETFSIITNHDEVLPLNNRIPGVTVQGGSDFVANRITIGPMSEALLGRWTLCGETSRDKRCQPVDIVWSNTNNPSQEWNTTQANQRDILTNNLAIVDATVRGAGGLLTCHVITPSGDDITINSDSTYRGIEFKPVQDSNLCTVSLGPIHNQFIGVWTIYAQFMSNTLGRSEVRSSFRIRLNDGEVPNQLLRDFAIRTRTGQSVNIALSKREDSLQETFSIITNKNVVLPLDNSISGVTVQGGSDFVANRITIGPMSDSLLGRWTLCGETSRDKRCQPVDIFWGNANNPSQEWNTTTADQEDIFTNNLAVVDATVRGAGGLLTCHIITPSGDDITVNSHSTYPGIEFKPVQDSNLCTVSLGPIHNQFIGVWTIYAQFMSNTLGRSEVRSSFRIRLNDGEAPIQLLRDFAIRTRTGQSVNIALSRREDSFQETFSIITNHDEVLPLNNRIPGVTVQGGSDFVANRITIGPMSESLLGRWTLCGETSRDKRCQPVDIVWSNTNNPSQEWNTTLANQRDIFTNNLAIVDATVRGAGGLLTCHVITPSGDDITVNGDSTYRGIEFKPVQDSNLCTVSLGPIHNQFIGVWTIYAQFMSNTLGRSEVRSSFRIRLNDGEVPTQLLRDFAIRTRTGQSVNIALSKREDSLQETFSIITNKNEVLPLDNSISGVTVQGGSDFVANRITIGPMSESLLGRWTLCGETSRDKRCQPVEIFWGNANNPSQEWNTTTVDQEDFFTNNLAVVDATVKGAGGLLTCHIITPSGDDITVNSDSTYPGIEFKPVQDSNLCTVTLGPIHNQFIGVWTIYAQFMSNTLGRSEVRSLFRIRLNDGEAPIQLLRDFAIRTRTGQSVNIALSKREDSLQETFSIITNHDEVLPLNNRIPGVTVQGGSDFVANRITIGPMSESLLGRWTLCGETSRDKRCQPVDIVWSNTNNPSQEWNTTQANQRDIFTNNLAIVDATVRGAGGLLTCHVITPSGDDITVNGDSTYRGIEFKPVQDSNLCTVSLGPIHNQFIGVWTIYAQFMSNTLGRSEVRSSFRIRLNDGEVPTQLLRDFAIRTRTGQSVNIALSKREDSLQETFSIITNKNEVLPLDNSISGVTVQGGSDFVANRITIGPMSESLLGRWTLCGETSRDKRCQPVEIFWGNANNPSQEWNTTTVDQEDFFTNNLAVVDATVKGAGGLLTCHIITPSGDDITVNSDSTYPGIEFKPVQDSNLCTVTLGPIHNQFIGVWTIYAQFMSNTLGRSEVRSSFRIRLNDGEAPIQLLRDFAIRTRTGQSVNIALSKREDSLQETFSIITNHDEVLPLNNRIPGVTVQGGSDFVANRITIGPMSESLLGRWTLCGETSQDKRCQPVDIVWSNTNNPSQEWNTTQANQRDIFTNNLAVVDATVRGAGGLLTCHIITPTGDDITVNSDSTYRGIEFKPVQDSNICTVSLGPIQRQFIGVWTIYAQFMSNTLGRSEVRSSFRLRLNDGEVATQWLPDFAIRTRTGQSVNIALSKREDSLQETFSIISNKNEVLSLNNRVPEVTVQGGSDFVANRITIGPMSDSLLGRWTLCGETSQDKRCQPVDIVWGNANNPSQEWNTTTVDQRDIVANNLAVVDVTVRGAGGLLTCHIITPSGDDITVNSDSTYPGIHFIQVRDSYLCTVSLGPIRREFIGDWTIYAQFMSNTLGRNEVRSHFRIQLQSVKGGIRGNIWLWFVACFTGLVLLSAGILLLPRKNRNQFIYRAASFRDSIRIRFSKKPLIVEAKEGSPLPPKKGIDDMLVIA